MAISLAVAAALVAALTGKGAQQQSRGHFLKKFSSRGFAQLRPGSPNHRRGW
jgi:hypothetical protein